MMMLIKFFMNRNWWHQWWVQVQLGNLQTAVQVPLNRAEEKVCEEAQRKALSRVQWLKLSRGAGPTCKRRVNRSRRRGCRGSAVLLCCCLCICCRNVVFCDVLMLPVCLCCCVSVTVLFMSVLLCVCFAMLLPVSVLLCLCCCMSSLNRELLCLFRCFWSDPESLWLLGNAL